MHLGRDRFAGSFSSQWRDTPTILMNRNNSSEIEEQSNPNHTQGTDCPEVPSPVEEEREHQDARVSTTSSESGSSSTTRSSGYGSKNKNKKQAASLARERKQATRGARNHQAVSNGKNNDCARLQGELDALKTQAAEKEQERMEQAESIRLQLLSCQEFTERIDCHIWGFHPMGKLEYAGRWASTFIVAGSLSTYYNAFMGTLSDSRTKIEIFAVGTIVAATLTTVSKYIRDHMDVPIGHLKFRNWIDTNNNVDMRPEPNVKGKLKLPSQLCTMELKNHINNKTSELTVCAQLMSQALASGTLMGVSSGADMKRAMDGCLRRISTVNQQRQYSLRGVMIPQDSSYVASVLVYNYEKRRAAYPGVGF